MVGKSVWGDSRIDLLHCRSASDLAQGMYVPGGMYRILGGQGRRVAHCVLFVSWVCFDCQDLKMEELKHNKEEKVSTGGRLNILYHLAPGRNLYTLQTFLCSSLRRQLGLFAVLSALKFS